MRGVLATGNAGKVTELRHWFPEFSWSSQRELGIPEIEETGLSFIENAILKARNAAKCSQLPALADDSGIIIDHLDGRPGIYSARYAKTNDFTANMAKVLTELAGVPLAERTARFCCVLALVQSASDPCPIIATGFWEGLILMEPIGEQGFGYDPIFLDPNIGLSAGQMSQELKNEISHRAKAIFQLKPLLANMHN